MPLSVFAFQVNENEIKWLISMEEPTNTHGINHNETFCSLQSQQGYLVLNAYQNDAYHHGIGLRCLL